jgi:hypothetical protein
MSLNWNAKNVEGWEEIPWEKRESAIFATMIVDLGEITLSNHVEWFERYTAYNFACGWDNYLSFADVKAMIGLTTNVSNTTPAAHRKRVVIIVASLRGGNHDMRT